MARVSSEGSSREVRRHSADRGADVVGSDVVHARGRFMLFGYETTPVAVQLTARSRRWRMTRAFQMLGLTALLARLVALVPPHAPWLIGAVVVGGVLARRRLDEHHTVVDARGPCPRCDRELSVRAGSRLRTPHPVSCDGCRHESALHVDLPP